MSAPFIAAQQAIANAFTERHHETRLLLLGLAAGEHVLLIGPPGTGKSNLVDVLSAIVGGRKWKHLFMRFTTPEEVYGPFSIPELEKGVYTRLVDGYLPTAELAWGDEIFKAGPAILNTLLPILNERMYFEHGAGVVVPLKLFVGASNELPDDLDDGPLAALFDRFMLRTVVEPIQDAGAFCRYLMVDDPVVPACRITAADIEAVRVAARKVHVPDAAIRALYVIRGALDEQKVVASDRRWKKIRKMLQTSAALDGRNACSPADLWFLLDALWQRPEQREVVAEVVRQHGQWTAGASMALPAVGAMGRSPEYQKNSPTPFDRVQVQGALRYYTQEFGKRVGLIRANTRLTEAERDDLVAAWAAEAQRVGVPVGW